MPGIYLLSHICVCMGFPGGAAVKNLPDDARASSLTPGSEGPPGEGKMASHSSMLAWEIPETEEPGGLQSVGLQRVGRDLVTK